MSAESPHQTAQANHLLNESTGTCSLDIESEKKLNAIEEDISQINIGILVENEKMLHVEGGGGRGLNQQADVKIESCVQDVEEQQHITTNQSSSAVE